MKSEFYKNVYIKELGEELRRLNSGIKYNEKFLKTDSYSYSNEKVKEVEAKIQSYQSEIKDANNTLEKIRNNEYDEKIVTKIAEIKEKAKEAEKRIRESKEKAKEEAEEKAKEKAKMWGNKWINKGGNKGGKKWVVYESFHDREYRYYCNNAKSFPKYLEKNLAKMPNNKGYIWKGICFYGKESADSKFIVVLFEKFPDKLRIHEWGKKYYKIFDKIGKRKKILIEETERIKKVLKINF